MSAQYSSVATRLALAAIAVAMPALTLAAEAGDTLEEIIVTAEKHQESAQKTAISMDVFKGEELLSAGVSNVQALTRIDPSINFTSSTGSAYVAVRGVASTDTTETGDPAIAVSRDGFFTNRSFGLFASMYDVARVEVLKGPQGTLYGRNTAGGVINIISQEPTDKFGGYATLRLGTYNTREAEAALNLPASDVFQLRLSGQYARHDGYTNNPGFAAGDDEDSNSGRLQLAIKPGGGFKALLSVQKDHQGGVGDVNYTGTYGTSSQYAATTPAQVTPAVPYGVAGGWAMAAPTAVKMDDTRLRWNLSQELGAGYTLTYLGGHDKVSYHHELDATTYPMSSNPASQFIQNENPATWNHELRVASSPDNRLSWQAGAFYFSEDNAPLSSGLLVEAGQFANQYLIDFQYAVKTTSKAVFGQANFRFNDQWKLSAGARYTEDHKSRTGHALLDLTVASGGFLWSDTGTATPFIPTPVFLCTSVANCVHFMVNTPGNGDIKNSRATYHLGVDWTPTNHNLVYAKFDTGYKAGGFNSNGSAPSVNYDPETVTSLEAGTKNRLLGDRLQANLSVFDMRYKGYQASQFTAAISGNASGVFNAGDADIYGAEGELVYLPAKETKLSLNATLLHAAFSDGCAVDASVTYASNAPACGSIVAGNYLPNSPNVSLRAGVEQGVVDGAGGRWTARLGGKYQSSYYYSIFNAADTRQRAYYLADFSLGYAAPSQHWEAEAYVHNLLDEAVLANAQRNANVKANNYEFQAPRTAGIRLTARF